MNQHKHNLRRLEIKEQVIKLIQEDLEQANLPPYCEKLLKAELRAEQKRLEELRTKLKEK